MNYKKRNSESDNYPQLVEHLQAGLLVRFNIVTETKEEEGIIFTYYSYVEFWFAENSTREGISQVVAECGFFLNEDYVI